MTQSAFKFEATYPPLAARVHEVCGAGAWMFAMAIAAQAKTRVIWIDHRRDAMLNPTGASAFTNINNIHFIHNDDAKNQLWCMEEILRSGAIGLAICAREKAIGFRDMRRLQLAAERGQATGLLMIPERFASPAAETRWRCEPIYDAQDDRVKSHRQRWILIKNKAGTLGEWEVNWDEETHRITLV